MRPRDEAEDERSDEDFDEQKLELGDDDIQEALETKIGGHEANGNHYEGNDETGKATHEENARSGIAIADAVWKTKVDPKNAKTHRFERPDTLDDILLAARDSRKREITLDNILKESVREPQLHRQNIATVKQVEHWRKNMQKEKTKKGHYY